MNLGLDVFTHVATLFYKYIERIPLGLRPIERISQMMLFLYFIIGGFIRRLSASGLFNKLDFSSCDVII